MALRALLGKRMSNFKSVCVSTRAITQLDVATSHYHSHSHSHSQHVISAPARHLSSSAKNKEPKHPIPKHGRLYIGGHRAISGPEPPHYQQCLEHFKDSSRKLETAQFALTEFNKLKVIALIPFLHLRYSFP